MRLCDACRQPMRWVRQHWECRSCGHIAPCCSGEEEEWEPGKPSGAPVS
jgi:hypothetical protein